MDVITQIFSYINGLGATITMPIIFTVFGLIVGLKFKEALRSGLLYGVGFAALWLVLDYFMGSLGDAASAISANLGLHLDVTDAGWMVGASMAFSSTLLPVSVICILGLNIVLLLTGFVRTLNIDIWNYWIMITGGVMIYHYTGSYVLGLCVILLTSVILLKLADLYAPKAWETIDLPRGISLPHMDTLAMAPIYMLVGKLLDKIPGLNKSNFDLDKLQDKIGVFGEPVFMGAILGALLGIASGYDFAQTANTAIVMATTMVIMPKVCSILMEALTPIADQTHEVVAKRFNGRDIYIGMDAAIAAGNPTVLLTSIIVIPFMLVMAAVLPGNRMLPLADLSSMALYVVWAVVAGHGDLRKSLICAAVGSIIYMYCGTFVANVYTDAAVAAGAIESGSGLISSISAGNPLYTIWLALAMVFHH